MSLTESLGAVVASQAAGVARIPEMKQLRNVNEQQKPQQKNQPIKNWDEYEVNCEEIRVCTFECY